MRFNQAKALGAVALLVTMSCARRQETASNQKVRPPAAASPSGKYPTLAIQAKEVNDAFVRKDFGKVSDMTYPKVVQTSGGREQMIALLSQGVSEQEAAGGFLVSSTPGEPTQIIENSGSTYAVIPTTMKIKTPEGLFQASGCMIGISTDNGQNWTFVDAGGKKETELKAVLPEVAGRLQIPKETGPVRISDAK
jgi:hypothetical protein